MQPHDIHIAGTERDAFLKDFARLVDRGEQQPAQDFLIRETAGRIAELRRFLADDPGDDRVGIGRAVALFVAIPAGTGLLAEAAEFAQPVGDRLLAVVRVLGRTALAAGPADVEPGEIPHREGPHRIAEIDHHLVDLLGQRALLQHDHGLDRKRRPAAIGEEPVAIAAGHAELADGPAHLHHRGQRAR